MLPIVFEGALKAGLLNQAKWALRAVGTVLQCGSLLVSSPPTLQHHLVSVAILSGRVLNAFLLLSASVHH